jgi:hypothetical protein
MTKLDHLKTHFSTQLSGEGSQVGTHNGAYCTPGLGSSLHTRVSLDQNLLKDQKVTYCYINLPNKPMRG